MTPRYTPIVLLVHPGAEMFGSDRMLLESAVGLRESGARVVVALPSRGLLDEELRAAGLEVVIVPMLVLRKLLLTPRGLPVLFRDTFRGLGAAWRLLLRLRPDAVYVSTIILPQWPVIARLRGARVISHVHEAEASGNRLLNCLLYLPHLASHRTLVNSRFSAETIDGSLRALARRSTVVYNGVVSPDDPTPPRRSLDGPLRVLFIGRLSPRKGPDAVIQAAGLLKARGIDVAVTLLGAVFPGYEWFEAQLREQAATTSVDVHFAGFHADVWPFLAESDVVVVPSRIDEPFGNTAVEGILALRPVIASDSSGLREAAGGYRTTRLVPPGEAESIASALSQVRVNWAITTAEVAASRREALRKHSPISYRQSVADVTLDNLPGTNTPRRGNEEHDHSR